MNDWKLKDFIEGERYLFSEMSVAAGYGGRTGGNFEKGIVLAPKENPEAIMIKMNLSKGLYPDIYKEGQDFFYYIGDGLPDKGPQKLKYGNKIMVEKQGLPVYLFMRYKDEKKGDPWTFKGRWRITGVERDFLSTETIPSGELQRVFRFKLVKSETIQNESEIFVDETPVDMFLSETSYLRATPEIVRIINPKHKKLANKFAKWLRAQGYDEVKLEQNNIDVTFKQSRTRYMSELKVVYGVSTTKSIREAMGQILEYNYYDTRTPYDEWVVLIDKKPTYTDTEYIRKLSDELEIPLNIGWSTRSDFEFQRPLE